MFKNVQNILDKDIVQVCRLCLAEEEDLIYIFNPEGYQGLRLCEVIEELLQMVVSKKDGLSWTICDGCFGKVKDFKNFKTKCIKSKISFLAMIANRGLVSTLASNTPTWSFQEPTNAFLKRHGSGTSGMDSDEVEVVMKEESPVVSEDEDPLREVTVVRREEGHGGKIDIKEDSGAGEPWSKEVSNNLNDHQENDTLDIGASNVVCLPIVMGELCGDKKENDSSESLAVEEAQGLKDLAEDESRLTSVASAISVPTSVGNVITLKDEVDENESIPYVETCGLEIHWKDGSSCTGVSNDAALADPFDMIDVKEDAGAGEPWSESVTYNENDLQENDNLDIRASNVVCLPIVMGELCGGKEEDDSSESLSGEEAQGVEDLAEDESRLKSVACAIPVQPSVGNVVDGCSMAVGSPEMCEDIVNDLIDNSKKNMTMKFERSTSIIGLPGEHSLKTMRTYIAENGESSKSVDYITITSKLSDVIPSKQSHLDSHKKQLEGCTELICDHCGVKYKDKNKLVVHVRGHISMNSPSTSVTLENSSLKCFESITTGIQISKRFKCEICGKEFNWKKDLCQHVLLHSDFQPFKCEICGKGYSGKNELKMHLVIHSGFKHFKCDICGREFNRKHNLVAHSFIHSGFRPFKCDICGRGFTQKSNLVSHSFIHSGLRPFKCDKCGKGFSQKYSLILHSVTHSGLRPFKCDKCGKGFSQKSSLSLHSVIHSGLRPFKCDSCGKDFNRKSSLILHLAMHSGLRPFKCDSCGKDFNRKSHLVTHSLTHSGFRPFKCKRCGKGFSQKSSLVRHSVIHSGLRPFKCDSCGKGFTRKSRLATHLVTHSGLGPFKCKRCGKGFSQKSSLVSHSVIHRGVGPFKCDTCGKGYDKKSVLVAHSVVHSGLKPFKCEICGKEYKWRTTFRRHSISHN